MIKSFSLVMRKICSLFFITFFIFVLFIISSNKVLAGCSFESRWINGSCTEDANCTERCICAMSGGKAYRTHDTGKCVTFTGSGGSIQGCE